MWLCFRGIVIIRDGLEEFDGAGRGVIDIAEFPSAGGGGITVAGVTSHGDNQHFVAIGKRGGVENRQGHISCTGIDHQRSGIQGQGF